MPRAQKRVDTKPVSCWPCRRKLNLHDRYPGWVNAPEYFAGMKKHFGFKQGSNQFIDVQMLQLDTSRIRIDVCKFDDWLHEQFGEYEEVRGQSMAELIEERYGREARSFVQRLL